MSDDLTIPEILTQACTAQITRGKAHELLLDIIAKLVDEAANRDAFAMQAMNALLIVHGVDMLYADIADDAYDMADKMMTARNL